MMNVHRFPDGFFDGTRKRSIAERLYSPLCDSWFDRCVIERCYSVCYWLKCHLWHPHNRLTVTTLPKSWTDRSEFLPHAMFQVLVDFVEGECIDESVDWESDECHSAARKSMDELLTWWRETYLKHDPWGDVVDGRMDGEDAHKSEEAMDEELTRQLGRLVDLRKWMWT